MFLGEEEQEEMAGWRPENDEAKIEFKKAVLGGGDEKQEDNLVSVQKDIGETAGKGAYNTKSDRNRAVKQMPESVRTREEAAARCTKKD